MVGRDLSGGGGGKAVVVLKLRGHSAVTERRGTPL